MVMMIGGPREVQNDSWSSVGPRLGAVQSCSKVADVPQIVVGPLLVGAEDGPIEEKCRVVKRS